MTAGDDDGDDDAEDDGDEDNADSDDDGIEVGSMFGRCAICGRSTFDVWSIAVREMFDR